MTNGHYVIPKLVEDASLKRARTEVEIDGETKDVIRVLPAGGAGLDAQGVANAMGLFPSSGVIETASVLDWLSSIENKTNSTQIYTEKNYEALGKPNDASWSGSGAGSLVAVEKRTSDDAHAVAEVLGTTSDSLVTLQDGTISARLRGITDLTSIINTNTSSIRSYTNSIDTFSSRISNATGTQSDAAWNGQTATATIIALLKGIYNKL